MRAQLLLFLPHAALAVSAEARPLTLSAEDDPGGVRAAACREALAKSEAAHEYTAQIDRLRTDLTFRSDEVQQARQQKSHLQSQLDELQARVLQQGLPTSEHDHGACTPSRGGGFQLAELLHELL